MFSDPCSGTAPDAEPAREGVRPEGLRRLGEDRGQLAPAWGNRDTAWGLFHHDSAPAIHPYLADGLRILAAGDRLGNPPAVERAGRNRHLFPTPDQSIDAENFDCRIASC